MSEQRPLEMILARNLLSSLSTPGALLAEDGTLLFFNEAAAVLLGRSFESVTGMTGIEWTADFGPRDEQGKLIPYEELPSAAAIEQRRPIHAEYNLLCDGTLSRASATAIPVGHLGNGGALVLFWLNSSEDSEDQARALPGSPAEAAE